MWGERKGGNGVEKRGGLASTNKNSTIGLWCEGVWGDCPVIHKEKKEPRQKGGTCHIVQQRKGLYSK